MSGFETESSRKHTFKRNYVVESKFMCSIKRAQLRDFEQKNFYLITLTSAVESSNWLFLPMSVCLSDLYGI